MVRDSIDLFAIYDEGVIALLSLDCIFATGNYEIVNDMKLLISTDSWR